MEVKDFLVKYSGFIRDGPNWTFRKNKLELIEVSRINKVSLLWVHVYFCTNTEQGMTLTGPPERTV